MVMLNRMADRLLDQVFELVQGLLNGRDETVVLLGDHRDLALDGRATGEKRSSVLSFEDTNESVPEEGMAHP
jgi:hypothetical protein